MFNTIHDRFHGLQILINDTEYTEIRLLGFEDDAIRNSWLVSVEATVYDHFGLDLNDAITYQGKHVGFGTWWLLQHTRGYRPFETVIKVGYMIKVRK
ncbi:DUF3289 family protein [Sphingobacterium bovistauri]|uniref:DUF3289 family protein n=1 Tax=Sphingobacterium bovistauri TaxID=2781959 RepID=A0ABS7Z9R2_9SPHI|nr:DUF3289 family protein [Sphingobacterium bovistauri]MCA5005620.1 DUF3289 family protein [Sphingobacterium bovistauri]